MALFGLKRFGQYMIGKDLLDENHATKSLFDLPKVKMYEVTDDQFVLKNLSVHRAENEEDALNLLFIGDTNRVVSETPKNDASTRSHCIFILQMECQKMGEDVIVLFGRREDFFQAPSGGSVWIRASQPDRDRWEDFGRSEKHQLVSPLPCSSNRIVE